jgi:Tol biopolymer transport system component
MTCAPVAGSGAANAPRDASFLLVVGQGPAYTSMTIEIRSKTGRLVRRIARLAGLPPEAEWSPDGSRLAWVGARGVMVGRADGGGRRLVFAKQPCANVCGPLSFAWSSDGRRLAIAGPGEKAPGLVVVTLETRRVVPLVRPHTGSFFGVAGWSRDGETIAFTRDVESLPRGPTLELMLVRADGTGRRRLFSAADSIHDGPSAAWSPDGRFIAFTTEHRDPPDPALAVVDVLHRKQRDLSSTGAVDTGVGPPAWSPDSRSIATWSHTGVAIVGRTGHVIRSFKTRGTGPIVWRRATGDLLLVGGTLGRDVFVSRGGRSAPRPLFRLPRGRSVMGLDVR